MAQEIDTTSLEDVMAAMDVVDTLRHQQGMVDRELDTQGRRERLLERLRNMYAAQGLDVPDQVLLEGIDALEQERFKYEPVAKSWRTQLAHLWVTRSNWGKPIGFLLCVALALWMVYYFVEIRPERLLRNALPKDIKATMALIREQAKSENALNQAERLASNAKVSLQQDNLKDASASYQDLLDLSKQLSQDYVIRVISRPNENSGVWRIPPGERSVRNYYLIVEAIDRNNRNLEIRVVNEENNKVSKRKTWGLRVNEQTFYRIASDKKDDGIIQANTVGVKRSGYLKPEYSVSTTGATITEW